MSDQSAVTARVLSRLEDFYKFQFLGATGRLIRAEARMRGGALGDGVSYYGRPIMQIHPGSRETATPHPSLSGPAPA